MKFCFECKTKHMFLVWCYYDDLYGHYDGDEKERWICLGCLSRRLGIKFDIDLAINGRKVDV